jgi:hypothetical protein
VATLNRKSSEAKGIDYYEADKRRGIVSLGLSKGSLEMKKMIVKIYGGGEKGCCVLIVRLIRLVSKNIVVSVAPTFIRPEKRPKETISALFFGLSSQRV